MMKPSRKFLASSSLILFIFGFFQWTTAQRVQVPEYREQVVAVQFEQGIMIEEGAAKTNMSGFDRVAARYGVYKIERVFPFLDYAEPTPKTSENLDALRRTYYIHYEAETDPRQVSRDFFSENGVIYAEPVLIMRSYGSVLQGEPNDPQYAQQQPYLELVHLPEAWDQVKSEDASEPVVIGIVDTGGDWDHEDLLDNVWINEDEIPSNKMDDDNNGFIDDIYGMNFENHRSGDKTDNDPSPDLDIPETGHGTAVAGTAGAVTDNGLGIAGAAWNAKLMHVNIYSLEDDLRGPIEGIVYAAMNGADIINASFGGITVGEIQRLITQALDLATDMGALIVAAAGNDRANNDLNLSYPDAHPRVLAVGATQRNSRELADFSNYGKSVDIYAPGVAVNSTLPDDEYALIECFPTNLDCLILDGTSFSAPLVSGIAALVKTRFPNLTPDELREWLRLSADNIDAENSSIEKFLNGGIVNAVASLEEVTVPAVRVQDWAWEDGDGNQQIDPGDEVTVSLTLINYLAPTEQLIVKLVPIESYPSITLLEDEQTVGILKKGESRKVTFRFSVADDVDQFRRTHFSVQIRDGSFMDAPDVLNFFGTLNTSDLVEALRALYESTDGDNWTNNTNWNPTAMPTADELSRWHGVVINQDQVFIFLVENNLKGMIPPELGRAKNITQLWLASNELSGTIPHELGQLSELELLLLIGNQLSGPIPPELGQLSKLQNLVVGSNQLSGSIPPEVGQLSELQSLMLAQNQLTGTVPSELGSLSKLKNLSLEENALTGTLPRSLMQLKNLEVLVFGGQELCSPEDDEFQEWLQKIPFVEGPVCTALATEGAEELEPLPENFTVQGNYPNPFQEITQLTFDLPWQAGVRVEVIDVIGRRVLSVPENEMMPGWAKSIELNATGLPAGIYLYRVIADSPTDRSVQSGRFVLVR